MLGEINMTEIWKEIAGYEAYYEISSEGRVRSTKRIIVYKSGKIKTINERMLLFDVTRGYCRVTLAKGGVNKRYMVHRLVADAFLPNPDNKACVNHIDSNRANNRLENLEWVSVKENLYHGYIKRPKKSEYVGVYADKSKWRANITIEGKRVNIGTFSTEIEAAKAYIEMSNNNGIINKYLQKV
jgi:hypothetical protein